MDVSQRDALASQEVKFREIEGTSEIEEADKQKED